MHFNTLIRGGDLVDGTGSPRRRTDVGITNGRIAEIGDLSAASADQIVDAAGLIVSPGFVDVHTHYDVQGFWDTTLSPSPLHGVTTAIGGNCGFSVAPLSDTSGEYLMRMLARVEGMPLTSLEQGVPWNWRSTAEFLDALDGRLAINTGFAVGHSAVRRAVMGDERRAATKPEIEAMAVLVRAGLAAGAIGFSSTWSDTHNDAEGHPVPSRFAEHDEVVTLAAVCGEFEGTSLEFIPTIGNFDEAHIEVMIEMSRAAQRPLNWNVITASEKTLERFQKKLAVGDLARQRGAKVVGLVVPYLPPARFNFLGGFAFDALAGWQGPMALPVDEKVNMFADPDGRRQLHESAQQPSNFRQFADWGRWTIVETFHPDNQRYLNRKVAEIAAEEDRRPVDVLFDIAVLDRMLTVLSMLDHQDTAADWQARLAIWRSPNAVIGASDAGAHLDMLATFSFSTSLLEHGVRVHQLLPLEEAVHRITAVQADLYGLRDRGRLVEGAHADIAIFDETTVGVGPIVTRYDLPGGAGRLYAEATGVRHVFVNGAEIVRDGTFTDARPGTMLRSGRDTYTPSMA